MKQFKLPRASVWLLSALAITFSLPAMAEGTPSDGTVKRVLAACQSEISIVPNGTPDYYDKFIRHIASMMTIASMQDLYDRNAAYARTRNEDRYSANMRAEMCLEKNYLKFAATEGLASQTTAPIPPSPQRAHSAGLCMEVLSDGSGFRNICSEPVGVDWCVINPVHARPQGQSDCNKGEYTGQMAWGAGSAQGNLIKPYKPLFGGGIVWSECPAGTEDGVKSKGVSRTPQMHIETYCLVGGHGKSILGRQGFAQLSGYRDERPQTSLAGAISQSTTPPHPRGSSAPSVSRRSTGGTSSAVPSQAVSQTVTGVRPLTGPMPAPKPTSTSVKSRTPRSKLKPTPHLSDDQKVFNAMLGLDKDRQAAQAACKAHAYAESQRIDALEIAFETDPDGNPILHFRNNTDIQLTYEFDVGIDVSGVSRRGIWNGLNVLNPHNDTTYGNTEFNVVFDKGKPWAWQQLWNKRVRPTPIDYEACERNN